MQSYKNNLLNNLKRISTWDIKEMDLEEIEIKCKNIYHLSRELRHVNRRMNYHEEVQKENSSELLTETINLLDEDLKYTNDQILIFSGHYIHAKTIERMIKVRKYLFESINELTDLRSVLVSG
ncbi:hypothetical protein [Oceanobacillus oncorhynchi]|uniref:hypothetical protein n=1 Tax=Oceanobacillus oncorhynchi TaxID=545501 RepID=UPI0034D6AF0F